MSSPEVATAVSTKEYEYTYFSPYSVAAGEGDVEIEFHCDRNYLSLSKEDLLHLLKLIEEES